MSESKRQIVIVSAVSVLIALSLGAGIYYTQAPPGNGQSTTTVTKVAGYTFTDTGGVGCAGYPSVNSSSSSPKAVPVPGAEVTPTPIAAWRYISAGNNTDDIQVAVISLLPG